MPHILSDAALCAAPSSAAPGFAGRASALLTAARTLLAPLEAGRAIDATQSPLRISLRAVARSGPWLERPIRVT